jgi:hypothetical protein
MVCTCICVVLSLLTVTSLAIVFKLVCVCGLFVSYSKCAEETFITEETTTLSNSKEMGGSVIVLSELLEC